MVRSAWHNPTTFTSDSGIPPHPPRPDSTHDTTDTPLRSFPRPFSLFFRALGKVGVFFE